MYFHSSDEDRHEKHYVRLARKIQSDIEEGRLLPGQRMPTVKEMCSKSGLSAGTVRQAYGLLKTQGLIELSPGRGTFVSVPSPNAKSRKARAMEEIDHLFAALSEMGFSQSEINMFLSLRLAQIEQAPFSIPAALIAQSPETLRCAFHKLSEIPSLELISFSLEEIRSTGAIMLSDFPLVLVEAPLFDEVSAILYEKRDALCPFVVAPTPQTLVSLAGISKDATAVVYCESDLFYRLVKRTVKSLSLPIRLKPAFARKLSEDTFADATCLISAASVASFTPMGDLTRIAEFSDTAESSVTFRIQPDEGSIIQISRRVSVLSERH